MTVATRMVKDPGAVLDFRFDWSAWLVDGEAITSGRVDATGVDVGDIVDGPSSVTVWLSGGVAPSTATVTCQVTTSQGRTDERTLRLVIQER